MAKSKGARGKMFEADLLASLANIGAWVERFPDKLIHRGRDLPAISVEGPPDLVALWRGAALHIECKAVNIQNARSIRFDRVKPHQLDSLLRFAGAGGHAYVAVLWYGRTNKSPDTRCALIPALVWERLRLNGKQSVNIGELEAVPQVAWLSWLGRAVDGIGPWQLTL